MKARVLVSFLEPAQGGRKAPFHGSRYATVARWVWDGHREEWSAVIDFGKPVTGGSEPLQGTLSFLATQPERFVRKGTQLELTEGSRAVALARVEGVVFDAPTDADDAETWRSRTRFRTDAEIRRRPSPSGPREERESV